MNVKTSWYGRKSIDGKLKTGFGTVLGLTTILGLSSCASIMVLARDSDHYARTASRAMSAARLESAAMRATLRASAYAETRHPDDLAAARSALGQANALMTETRAATSDSNSLADLDDVSAQLTRFEQLVREVEAANRGQEVDRDTRSQATRLQAEIGAVREKIDSDIVDFERIAARDETRDEKEIAWLSSATEVGITALVALVLLLGGLAALRISGDLSGAVQRLTAAVLRLARGERGVEVPEQGRTDEIGDMARAMEVFKANAEEVETLQREAAEAAHRDTERVRQQQAEREAQAAQRRAEMLDLAARFEQYVGSVARQVGQSSDELHTAARHLAESAEQTQTQAAMVASASGQASANVMTVAAAGDELNESISEISRQMNHSAKIAIDVANDVRTADEQVGGLVDAVEQIDTILALIGNIAGRTNMLALNATIEAARAGEAGKGFSVVASEVKALALQTRDATTDIGSLLASIRDGSRTGAKALGTVAGRVMELETVSTAVASAVDQQALASREVAQAIDQAAMGTELVNKNIGEVSRAAQMSGSAASQVLGSAQMLRGHSEALRQQLDEFLGHLRAA